MLTAETMTPRQKTLALVTLVVALVLEIVDMTIVNTALPAIQAGIGADASHAQWIVAGYSVSFALLLMAGGRMGDAFGYRRMFLLGVAGFTLASLACGLARNGDELVAARVLQGMTGAIMAPQSMALLQILFSPLERVSKLAMFGIIGGLASIAGPIIGGLLIDADVLGLGWRLVFLINLPVGVLAMAAAAAYLPSTRSGQASGYDGIGTLYFGLAVAFVLWPLIALGEAGSQRPLAILWLMLLSLPLVWFGWRHVGVRTSVGRSALFDPAIFAIATFRSGLGMSIAFSAASAGFLLVFAFALQNERGETPLMTGLLHMPFGFGAMFGIGFLSRNLLPRVGRWLPLAGSLTMAGTVLMAMLAISDRWSLWSIGVVMMLCGIGMGMTTGCIGPITFAHMDRDHAGAASGLTKTSQQLGSALGVALAGSAYFGWSALIGQVPTMTAGIIIAAMLCICALIAAGLPGDIFGQAKATQSH